MCFGRKWFRKQDFIFPSAFRTQATRDQPKYKMLSDPIEMQLLQMIVKMIGAKKTLDIGKMDL